MSDTEPSLRDRLLAAPGTPAGEFALSGVRVFLRRLTLRDRLRVQQIGADRGRSAFDRQADLCRLLIGDERNARVFGDAEADRDAALDLSGPDTDALIEAALAANGLTAGAADAAGKASKPTPNSG